MEISETVRSEKDLFENVNNKYGTYKRNELMMVI